MATTYRKFNCSCGTTAVWVYMPSSNPPRYPYFCENCVSRGCSCGHEFTPDSDVGQKNGFGELPPKDNNWKWIEESISWCLTDELGRELPCCEFSYQSDGFVVEKDELDFYRENGIKYNI